MNEENEEKKDAAVWYYYDWNDMSWKNSNGRKVRIEDVDPYMMSYEDEDAYYAQKNGK